MPIYQEYNLSTHNNFLSSQMPPLEYFFDPPQFNNIKAKLLISKKNPLINQWNNTINKSNFFIYFSLCCQKILTRYGDNSQVIIIDTQTREYLDIIMKSFNDIQYLHAYIFYKIKNIKNSVIELTTKNIPLDDCEVFYNFMMKLKIILIKMANNVKNLF